MEMYPIEILPIKGQLTISHFRGPNLIYQESSKQTITTVGKNWIVDKLQDLPASTAQVKWHQSGINATAATSSDTDLGSAIYSRTSGSRTEGASANIYRSVATISYTGTRTVTEWGIFTTSSSGTMISRKTFSRSVVNGDSIQFTWDLTVG